MNAALHSARTVASPREYDERSLLIRLELLLEREEELLEARDADGLFTLAEERERLTAQLGQEAQDRRETMHPRTSVKNDDDGVGETLESELIALYQRLRQRHDVRARVIRRYSARNDRALGVLAQATHQPALYGADGRMAVHGA